MCSGNREPMKDDKLRKAMGVKNDHIDPWISEWGKRAGREPGELKHLSTPEEEKENIRFPKVAASEMERAQTGVRAHRGSTA